MGVAGDGLATDVFGESDAVGLRVALDVEGLREVRRLTAMVRGRVRPGGGPGECNRFTWSLVAPRLRETSRLLR